jgi:hypothetical protein
MKNTSTGFGLALLAGAILAYPFVSNLASTANASAVTAAASAVSTAATAQTGPTIVWYGVSSYGMNSYNDDKHMTTIARAWSDGRVEIRRVRHHYNMCQEGMLCETAWLVVSDPNLGYSAASDINFDEKVDGADLGQLLSDWGDAPRQDIPPSDCPLALINP